MKLVIFSDFVGVAQANYIADSGFSRCVHYCVAEDPVLIVFAIDSYTTLNSFDLPIVRLFVCVPRRKLEVCVFMLCTQKSYINYKPQMYSFPRRHRE